MEHKIMSTRKFVPKLIKIANDLDSLGQFSVANDIDALISKFASPPDDDKYDKYGYEYEADLDIDYEHYPEETRESARNLSESARNRSLNEHPNEEERIPNEEKRALDKVAVFANDTKQFVKELLSEEGTYITTFGFYYNPDAKVILAVHCREANEPILVPAAVVSLGKDFNDKSGFFATALDKDHFSIKTLTALYEKDVIDLSNESRLRKGRTYKTYQLAEEEFDTAVEELAKLKRTVVPISELSADFKRHSKIQLTLKSSTRSFTVGVTLLGRVGDQEGIDYNVEISSPGEQQKARDYLSGESDSQEAKVIPMRRSFWARRYGLQ